MLCGDLGFGNPLCASGRVLLNNLRDLFGLIAHGPLIEAALDLGIGNVFALFQRRQQLRVGFLPPVQRPY